MTIQNPRPAGRSRGRCAPLPHHAEGGVRTGDPVVGHEGEHELRVVQEKLVDGLDHAVGDIRLRSVRIPRRGASRVRVVVAAEEATLVDVGLEQLQLATNRSADDLLGNFRPSFSLGPENCASQSRI